MGLLHTAQVLASGPSARARHSEHVRRNPTARAVQHDQGSPTRHASDQRLGGDNRFAEKASDGQLRPRVHAGTCLLRARMCVAHDADEKVCTCCSALTLKQEISTNLFMFIYLIKVIGHRTA